MHDHSKKRNLMLKILKINLPIIKGYSKLPTPYGTRPTLTYNY